MKHVSHLISCLTRFQGQFFIISIYHFWLRPIRGLLIVLLTSLTHLGWSQCTHPDYVALTDLYNATNGPNWTTKTNWLTGCDICDWYGVNCDVNGRVSLLELSNNQLSGSIPASLSALSDLQELYLSSNQLSGSIPASLSALTNLKDTRLNNNQLSGSIPESLSALSNLTILFLDVNQLSGSIPASLSALTNLLTLALGENQLSGSIPPSLGALSNLSYLNLEKNQLSGSIPASLSALSNLSYLNLEENQLSGGIPASLGTIISLESLRLNNNQLSGSIPASLGNLPNIQYFYLQHNQLTGCFPTSLTSLCGRSPGIIDFSFNSGLPGGGDFSAFCSRGANSGTGQASASATSADIGSVLSLSASGGETYQWIAPSGAILSSPTTNPVVSATIINSGVQTFTVLIGDGDDCRQTIQLSINAPLPVNLTSFSAQLINNQAVKLNWTTASEQDNDYFMLERSKDLLQVEPLAKIKAREGGSFQGYTYAHTDEKPYGGTSYYRLRQVDLNGTTTTYPWESVIVRKKAYGVSPNPISDQQFSLQLDEPLTATINFYTLEGQPVVFRKVGNGEGSLQLKTEQKLPTGMYILTVEERAQTRQYRLVVE